MAEPDASVDSNTEDEPSPAEWQQFEKDAQHLFEGLAQTDPEATIRHNVKVVGILSGEDRQVDVLIEGTMAGQPIRIAVECKCYKKPLGIGIVEEFDGKLRDLGAHRGVLFSRNGFSKPARNRADHPHTPQITLYDLTLARPTELDFTPVFRGLGDCPNENCIAGEVDWRELTSATGETLEFGSCWSCGTQAVRCRECESVTGFVWSEQQCDWCDANYRLVHDHDFVEVESIVFQLERDEIEFT